MKSNRQRFCVGGPNRQTGNSRREKKATTTATKIIAVRKDAHRIFFRFNTKIKMVENVCSLFFLFFFFLFAIVVVAVGSVFCFFFRSSVRDFGQKEEKKNDQN